MGGWGLWVGGSSSGVQGVFWLTSLSSWEAWRSGSGSATGSGSNPRRGPTSRAVSKPLGSVIAGGMASGGYCLVLLWL